jgi:potassium-transporting ATPase KdpC subunit
MATNTMLRQTLAGLRLLLVMTVVTGLLYPMAIWGITRLPGLHAHAEGSRIVADGRVVGSSLIGVDPVDPAAQANPTLDRYFHVRPSSSAQAPLGPGDPSASGGSNDAGDNEDLLKAVQERRAGIAVREGVAPEQVPADAVTASASGVDPDISPAYAELQVRRVARVNGLSENEVRRLVAAHTSGGLISERVVNVPVLNMAVHGLAR